MKEINDLTKYAERILKAVISAYCFGSTNKGHAFNVSLKFARLLKAIVKIFSVSPTSEVYAKILQDKTLSLNDIVNLKKQAIQYSWSFEKNRYFNPQDPVFLLPLERFTEKDSKILRMINHINPFNDSEIPNSIWTDEDIKALPAVFASYLLDYDAIGFFKAQQLSQDPNQRKEFQLYQYFTSRLYEPGIEAKSQAEQMLFFEETLKSVKRSCPMVFRIVHSWQI